METTTVVYAARVFVEVDVESGKVMRVIAEVDPDRPDSGTADLRAQLARAIEVAESAEWPAWDFGF